MPGGGPQSVVAIIGPRRRCYANMANSTTDTTASFEFYVLHHIGIAPRVNSLPRLSVEQEDKPNY
jgi:hypothetical protein